MSAILLLLLGYLALMPVLQERSGPVGTFITGGTPVEQIVKMTINKPDGQTVSYVQDAGHWQIREPYQAAASQPIIRELLAAVQKTRIMDIVEEHPENLSRYGLGEKERIDVTLEFKNGNRHTFHIGARLPLNQIYIYFQREGDPAIFRIWEGIRLALEKNGDVLDQGQPVQFNPADIISLKLLHKGHTLYIEKRQEDWIVTQPVQRAADNEAVESYLDSILALRSIGVPPSGTVFRNKSSNTDTLQITLEQGAKSGQLTVLVTREDSISPTLLSVEQDEQSKVYATTAGAVEQLLFDPDDFYLPVALFFDDSDITDIKILHPHYSLELGRQPDGTWQFYQSSGVQLADADVVRQLLHLLGNLPAGQYLEKKHGITDAGRPEIIVTLSGTKNSTALKIIEDPSGQYHGTSEFHPGWYRLEAEMVKRLEAFNPEALVDRHLMVFDPRSVNQVIIELVKNDYVMTKKESGWRWEKPFKKKVGNAAAWKLIFDIRDMQYQDQVLTGETAIKNGDVCISQDSDIVIEVKLAATATDQISLKARQTSKGWIVSSSRLPGCYQVEPTLFDSLIDYLETLADKP